MAELRKDPKWYEPLGIFAGGGAINAGIATPQEQQRIFAREFADRVSRLASCPFDVYYNLQAMSRMGRYDVALAMVRDHWGGQINYGATTLFEEYWPQWNQFLGKNDPVPSGRSGYTSLAHPWGSGVTSWLTRGDSRHQARGAGILSRGYLASSGADADMGGGQRAHSSWDGGRAIRRADRVHAR